MMTRRERKKNSYMQLGILVLVVIILVILYRYVLRDLITKFAEENPLMASILMLTVLLVFTANVLYANICQKLSRTLTDEPIDFVTSVVPVLCDFNLSKLYYNNELMGSAPLVNLVVSILNFLVYWVGFAIMVLKYGFLVIYEPHFIWIIASFITYFICICTRSYIVGKIIASYDDYIPFKHVGLFYILPIALLFMELVFYIVLGPVLALFNVTSFFLKSSLFNFTALAVPFILPIISYLESRYLNKHILYAEEDYEDYEFDEEDDSYYDEDDYDDYE